MLSIGAMSSGQQGYYLDLAREDYYLNGGEPPGVWHGQGAGDLGLSGIVDGEALTRLFEGFHPTDDRTLIQQQHYQDRDNRPGWDFTFSAPKSVSVLWSQADQETRKAIQNAHFAAVKAGLDYLEDEIAVTRTGKGGADRESARLVIATFEHHTSRAEEPQVHTHCLILNVCTDAAGVTRTIESRPLYRAKMAAGAIYQAEFAAQLEKGLRLTVERHPVAFEIAGVSPRLAREFSTRRAEIEKAMEEKGYEGAAAAAIAALDTRHVKGHVSQEELSKRWQETGRAFAWGPEQAQELLRTARPTQRDSRAEARNALGTAGERSTEQQSYFSRREFTRHVAEEALGRGLGAKEIRQARDTYLSESEDIVRLGRYKGELVYTTRDLMEVERALLASVERSKSAYQAGVSERTVAGVIATRKSFGEDQERALRHITEAGGTIRLVSGVAGSGKTTLLHAARLSWELEGFEVHGAAVGGKAAQGLSQGSGIQSETLRRTLFDIQNGRLKLHERSVLVVDEAGMVGTRIMREVEDATQKAGARLILVGEARQLQPIDAGGPFAEIQKRLGAAELTEIRRQREEWARGAVKDFAEGDSRKGLRAYAERGLLSVSDDRRQAMDALVSAWKVRGVHVPEEQLILTGTRHEAQALNRMAQEERRVAGKLMGEGVSIPESNQRLFAGDRILFTKKSRLYGVENGSLGEVTALDTQGQSLTVRLDSGEHVRFTLDNYSHVCPGYAMTTHKGQGATTERAYVLVGGPMQDREISYVQASRSRGETRLFTDREEAGEDLTRIVRQMAQSRQKEMALAVLQPSYDHDQHTHRMGL